MTALFESEPVDTPQHHNNTHAVFRKRLPRSRADAEIRGWHAVAPHLPVAELHGRSRVGDHDVICYTDVFASGRCEFLLGDLIARADREPSTLPQVEHVIDEICTDLCEAAERSGQTSPFSDCVPDLYTARLRRGGRLDAWYLRRDPSPGSAAVGTSLSLRALADYELHVHDRIVRVDIEEIIADARSRLTPDSRWATAITQGDPTEPNIAYPRCWLDFEYAGRNTLVGEIANLLWYLLALGGWLVPRYQPETYTRTLRLALAPEVTPTVEHVDVSPRHRRIELSYAWTTGAGRRAALARLATRINGDLGQAAGLNAATAMSGLRSFLVLRILAVIPPQRLTGADLLLLLVKLAESQHPDATLESFAAPAETASPDRSCDAQHAP